MQKTLSAQFGCRIFPVLIKFLMVQGPIRKDAVVLHMLRGVVGDSTFFNILRSYTADPSVQYGVATTEDFQAIAESVSGMDLNYFFQEWIYGENFPSYSVVWSNQNISGNLYDLSLKISQNVNSNPSFFTMPIQIKVNFATAGDTINYSF